jgi:hypothetical protein
LIVLAALAPAAAAGQVPVVAPPTQINPFYSAQVNTPTLFQWTALAPGQTFNIGVSRTAKAGHSIIAASYELQISDRPDVTSHVLFDTVVDQTSFLFLNSQNEPGFTSAEPPYTALVGGTYYWRVRGIFAGTGSGFSRIEPFVLTGPGVNSSLHALGLTSIGLAGVARQGTPTPVLVQVRDLGNFPEGGNAPLTIYAGGQAIGTVNVPTIAVGKSLTVTAIWTPQSEGLVQISAQLNYPDDNPKAHTISQTEVVTGQSRRHTTMVGVVGETLGSYYLSDARSHIVATLTQGQGSTVTFSPYVGSRVEVDGYLSTARGDFVFEASAIKRLPAATPRP